MQYRPIYVLLSYRSNSSLLRVSHVLQECCIVLFPKPFYTRSSTRNMHTVIGIAPTPNNDYIAGHAPQIQRLVAPILRSVLDEITHIPVTTGLSYLRTIFSLIQLL